MAENKKEDSKKELKIYEAPEKGTVMFIPNGKKFKSEKQELKQKLVAGKGIIVSDEDGRKLAGYGLGKIKNTK